MNHNVNSGFVSMNGTNNMNNNGFVNNNSNDNRKGNARGYEKSEYCCIR